MDSQWTIALRLAEKNGTRTFMQAVDLPTHVLSERTVSDMRLDNILGAGSFSNTVKMLKERKFRRDLLREACLNLAERLADHLEDQEGWHGEDRQAKVVAATKWVP